jgi:hypothetical protein
VVARRGEEMAVISIQQVIGANQLMSEHELPYKVHLSDACGRQSCWLEETAEASGPADLGAVRAVLVPFFSERRTKLEFSDDGTRFWAV